MTAVVQEHNEQIDQEECPWEDIENLTANGISAVSFLDWMKPNKLSIVQFTWPQPLQTDVKKLKDAGIQTVAALTMHTRKVRDIQLFWDYFFWFIDEFCLQFLCSVKGFSDAKVDKL
jgi:hypothetical protein